MLEHASIALTADTYTSVLPEVSRRSVEGIAALIVQAGRIPSGGRWDSPSAHHGPTTRAGWTWTGAKSPGCIRVRRQGLEPRTRGLRVET
jgi:hypothetical protein